MSQMNHIFDPNGLKVRRRVIERRERGIQGIGETSPRPEGARIEIQACVHDRSDHRWYSFCWYDVSSPHERYDLHDGGEREQANIEGVGDGAEPGE